MNAYFTNLTTKTPSLIELLGMAIELEAQSLNKNNLLDQNMAGTAIAIKDIWLPVFRGASNLRLALDALVSCKKQDDFAAVCQHYISALEATDANS